MMDTKLSELFTEKDLSSLNSEAPTPLYYQMFTLLKNHILEGSIPHGAQLPTEQQLAESFQVSRITAKRAMDELAALELVERRRGKGTHVTHHYKPDALEAPLVGMIQKLTEMSKKTKVKVIDIGKLLPPSEVRKAMELEENEKIHRVIRIRHSEDGPAFAHHISWTAGVKKGMNKRDLERLVRLDILKDNGLEIHKIEQDISAAAVDAEVGEMLDMQAGDPVLTLTRRSYTKDGKLVDILYCKYNPKRFQYRMTMGLDEYRS